MILLQLYLIHYLKEPAKWQGGLTGCGLHVVFAYILVEQRKEQEDYIKSELIGGGSTKYLNNFTNFILIILLVYTTHISIDAIVHCTTYIIASATTFFEDLVTLHRRTLQHIF